MIKQTSETSIRKKTGREIEQSVFLTMYKDDPATLKKAKFYPVRVRDEATGRMVVEQVTKVFDQQKGVRLFEDIESNSIIRQSVIDDGRVQLVENHDQRVMEDAAELMHEQERGGGPGLTVHDFVESQSSKSPTQKNKPKKERAEPIGDSSSEEMTPRETHGM